MILSGSLQIVRQDFFYIFVRSRDNMCGNKLAESGSCCASCLNGCLCCSDISANQIKSTTGKITKMLRKMDSKES